MLWQVGKGRAGWPSPSWPDSCGRTRPGWREPLQQPHGHSAWVGLHSSFLVHEAFSTSEAPWGCFQHCKSRLHCGLFPPREGVFAGAV